MITTDTPIAITQVGMCVLENIEYETRNTGSRANASICLIESFTMSFISSPVRVPLRAMSSISRMVLNGQRKEIGISWKRYRQTTTHARKAVIAVNALDESSS